MIILGAKYKDKVTGFAGVAMGHVNYLSGCHQVLLAPEIGADGKLPESHWFDDQRCDRVGDGLVVLENANAPGFDKAPPTR